MKYIALCLLVALSMFAAVSLTVASGKEGRIEFNGHYYNSLEEVIQAHSPLGNPGQVYTGLGCGPRMTQEVLNRGYYDFRIDRIVCFDSRSDGDSLYDQNRALIDSHTVTNMLASTAASNGQYQCTDYHHGAPFLGYFYLHPVDEVCLSNPIEYAQSGWRFRSYWQQGSGRTYFYYQYFPDMYFFLDYPTIWTPSEVQGHAMQRYEWCRLLIDGTCY